MRIVYGLVVGLALAGCPRGESTPCETPEEFPLESGIYTFDSSFIANDFFRDRLGDIQGDLVLDVDVDAATVELTYTDGADQSVTVEWELGDIVTVDPGQG